MNFSLKKKKFILKQSKYNDYDVGYKKPPRESRFKPGQSGNPKGRPAGEQNIATLLKKAAAKKKVVIENGVKKLMSMKEIMVSNLMSKAAKGDLKACQVVYGIIVPLEEKEDLKRSLQNELKGNDLKLFKEMLDEHKGA